MNWNNGRNEIIHEKKLIYVMDNDVNNVTMK